MSSAADKERELQALYDRMSTQTPYEIFGVWEGCGQQIVNEKYYVLVKEHHPDSATAGVDSALAKQLANDIFIHLQKAYKILRKREREQKVASPTAQQQERKSAFDRLRQRTEPKSDALSQASEAYDSMSEPDTTQATTSNVSRPATSEGPRSAPAQARSTTRTLGEDSLSDDERRARLSSLRSRQAGRRGRSTLPIGTSALSEPSDISASPRGQPIGADERRARLEALRQRSASLPADARDPSRPLMVTPKNGLGALNARTGLPDRGIDPDRAMDWEKPLEEMTAHEAFNVAWRDFQSKLYKKALPAFEYAHKAEPEHCKYLTFYAYTLFVTDQANHVDEATKLLQRAVKIGERQSLPDAHLFLGLVYKFKGGKDIKRAGPHFAKATELNPMSNLAAREHKAWQEKHGGDEPQESAATAFLKKLFKK